MTPQEQLSGPPLAKGVKTTCFEQGQWHEYTTIVRENYEITADEGRILDRSSLRVVCKKCGDVIDPFTERISKR